MQIHHHGLKVLLFGVKRSCDRREQKKERSNFREDFVVRIA
jgi:hypothetical protein